LFFLICRGDAYLRHQATVVQAEHKDKKNLVFLDLLRRSLSSPQGNGRKKKTKRIAPIGKCTRKRPFSLAFLTFLLTFVTINYSMCIIILSK